MRHLMLILTLLFIIIPHPVKAEGRKSPHLKTNITSSARMYVPVAGQPVPTFATTTRAT